MKRIVFSGFLGMVFLFSSCQQRNPLFNFCENANPESYSPDFQVWCPTQLPNNYVPLRYGCPPNGMGVSPPIAWSGIPNGTTHLRLIIEDSTCTYGCDECCKYYHLILDIPVDEMGPNNVVAENGISEGAAKDPRIQKYMFNNSNNQKAYMPFCPPKIQTHAYVYKLIAYKIENGKTIITGRAMSHPLLYSLTQNSQ
jgi:phosphatidylethanolamine-binding protein (PEBP) family uncharacterized protein